MRSFNNRKAIEILIAVILAGVMVLMAGCHVNLNIGPGSSDNATKNEEQVQELEDEPESADDPADAVLQAVVPPEDFEPAGEYQDETSQRAMMTITPEGEEGHYSVLISWGSSAFETTIWEFDGDFDYDSGMLTYENCCKYELTVNEDGEQKEDEIYQDGKGALLYYEDGFHWDNKGDDDGKDCYFKKIDDLSDAIIEEDDE